MQRSIEVHCDLQVGDVYGLFFAHSIRKLIYARWVVALVLMVVIAAGTRYAGFVALLIFPPSLYLVVGLLIYLAVVVPYTRSRAFVRGTMRASSRVSYILGEGGIDVNGTNSKSHYSWEAVRKAKQTSNLILLYLEEKGALVIPKRCFADRQQMKDAQSLVSLHAKSRSKGRDYWP